MAVNLALNWTLIHGVAGIPVLGLTGIGVSTSLVYVVTFGIFAVTMRRDPQLRPMLSLAMHRADVATVRTILRLGVPIAGTYSSEAGLFSVTAVVIGSFGAPALAAHTVVNQLTYIVFQLSVGISHGCSILVSRVVGLGVWQRSRQIAGVALSHGAIVVAAAGLVYLFAPVWLLSLFMDTSDATTVSIATALLGIASPRADISWLRTSMMTALAERSSAGGELVAHQHRRCVGERASNSHPLPLPPGEPLRQALGNNGFQPTELANLVGSPHRQTYPARATR